MTYKPLITRSYTTSTDEAVRMLVTGCLYVLLLMIFYLFVSGTLRRYISDLSQLIAVKLSNMIGTM